MFFKIDSIELLESKQTIQKEQLSVAVVQGHCTFTSWKIILHFTRSGKILEANTFPLFGCKNYDKSRFHNCVPQSSGIQTVPCPILTQHLGDIKLLAIIYLVENGFIDKVSHGQDGLVQQAINIAKSKV